MLKIPFYKRGQLIILEGNTAEELLKHIECLKEDGTLVMKDCHVEGETLCLD